MTLFQTDWFTNTVAIVLLLAQFPIYLPQYLKIYRRGYSLGHHPWFMLMIHTASLLAWINALIYYIHSWHSYCAQPSLPNSTNTSTIQPLSFVHDQTVNCLASVYGLIYFWVQWLFQFIWYLMYLSFLGPEPPEYDSSIHLMNPIPNPADPVINYACQWQPQRRKTYLSFLVSISLGIIVFIVTLFLISSVQIDDSQMDWHNFQKLQLPSEVLTWSYCLELIIMNLFAFCYLAQLYEIVRLAQTGSFSLLSQSLMIPSNLVWTIFLANWSFLAHHHPDLTPAEPIEPVHPNTTSTQNSTLPSQAAQVSNIDHIWIPYLVMIFGQLVVLGFGFYYQYYNQIADWLSRIKQSINHLLDQLRACWNRNQIIRIESPATSNFRSESPAILNLRNELLHSF